MDDRWRILITAACAPLAIWLFGAFIDFITDMVKLLPEGRIRRFLLWRTER